MGKRILAGACIGWAAIVYLAWWLAHMRIEICHKASYSAEANCAVRATAARDHVLTSGLTVALVGAVAAAIMWSIVRERNVDRQALIQPRSIPAEGNGLVTRPALASPLFTWRAPWPRRGVVLAIVFGMCLAGSLMWWGGMVRPVQLFVGGNGLMPASVGIADDGFGDPLKLSPRLVPVEGDPFAVKPIARQRRHGGDGNTIQP